MISDSLPKVLLATKSNSISMERALKQIEVLLENYQIMYGASDSSEHHRIDASLDDIHFMLESLT